MVLSFSVGIMAKFKRIFGLFIIVVLGVGCIATLIASSEVFRRDKTPAIGIFLSFYHPSFDQCTTSFQKTLEKKHGDLRFIICSADNSVSKARQISRQFYKNSAIQGIFTVGPLATKIMSQIEDKKPLVFSAIHDAESMAFYKNTTNIHGIEDRLDVDQIFFAVKSLNAKAKSVLYLQPSSETFSHVFIRDIRRKFIASGIDFLEETLVPGNLKTRLRQLLEKRPSVILLPLDPLVGKNISLIVEEALEKSIPIVTVDVSLIDRGVCAACSIDYKKSGEQAATMMNLLIRKDYSSEDIKRISLEPLPQMVTFNDDRIGELGLKLNKNEKKQIRPVFIRKDGIDKRGIS